LHKNSDYKPSLIIQIVHGVIGRFSAARDSTELDLAPNLLLFSSLRGALHAGHFSDRPDRSIPAVPHPDSDTNPDTSKGNGDDPP
jgi:hypothetical protein